MLPTATRTLQWTALINGPKNLITVKSLTVAELKLALAAEKGAAGSRAVFWRTVIIKNDIVYTN